MTKDSGTLDVPSSFRRKARFVKHAGTGCNRVNEFVIPELLSDSVTLGA